MQAPPPPVGAEGGQEEPSLLQVSQDRPHFRDPTHRGSGLLLERVEDRDGEEKAPQIRREAVEHLGADIVIEVAAAPPKIPDRLFRRGPPVRRERLLQQLEGDRPPLRLRVGERHLVGGERPPLALGEEGGRLVGGEGQGGAVEEEGLALGDEAGDLFPERRPAEERQAHVTGEMGGQVRGDGAGRAVGDDVDVIEDDQHLVGRAPNQVVQQRIRRGAPRPGRVGQAPQDLMRGEGDARADAFNRHHQRGEEGGRVAPRLRDRVPGHRPVQGPGQLRQDGRLPVPRFGRHEREPAGEAPAQGLQQPGALDRVLARRGNADRRQEDVYGALSLHEGGAGHHFWPDSLRPSPADRPGRPGRAMRVSMMRPR